MTPRTLIATVGAAAAALAAMAWLCFARAGNESLEAALGKALFERLWVAAPASTAAADGLGPLFNARSCAACHQDGGAARFAVTSDGARVSGLVVRVATLDGKPHPELGTQLQDRALPGLTAEAKLKVDVEGGMLRVKTSLSAAPELPALFETRLAPSLIGRAQLEEIDAEAVLALADPHDEDGDDISGRTHMVLDGDGNMVLGRYGAKASGWSLMQQTADAAAVDIGLSSPLVPRPAGDCTELQAACTARLTGRSVMSDGEEISQETVRLITGYLRTLDPKPVDVSTDGFRVFAATGCASCHLPSLPARDGTPRQLFTDLLLHDLGSEGASRIKTGDAEPGEWRTAPLRGLDPLQGARRYMHDGRAATLREAVALHGGEATRARSAFAEASGRDQKLLIDFLAKL